MASSSVGDRDILQVTLQASMKVACNLSQSALRIGVTYKCPRYRHGAIRPTFKAFVFVPAWLEYRGVIGQQAIKEVTAS